MRMVAPAGAPIRLRDLVRWGVAGIVHHDVADALKAELRARFSVRHVFLTSTGRAGLTMLLAALRRLSPGRRDEVIVPSYTCYSVAASAVKAGLRPRIVDISASTLDYDPRALEAADYSRVLAIIATNLYGLPNDLPRLSQIARNQGLFLIDDAAQAMGAVMGGRLSGTWGDGGLFSFDKGKNISAIDGGVVVTNSDDIAAAIHEDLNDREKPGLAISAVHLAKALAYFAALRPSLYGIPARIPQLGLGQTVFTTDFQLAPPDPILSGLALTMLKRLDEFNIARIDNAAAIRRQLDRSMVPIEPIAGARPVYLRLPILTDTTEHRTELLASLQGAGIGAAVSYPASLADVEQLRPHIAGVPSARNGREVARRLLTLPTHPFVSARDVQLMGEVSYRLRSEGGSSEDGETAARAVSGQVTR